MTQPDPAPSLSVQESKDAHPGLRRWSRERIGRLLLIAGMVILAALSLTPAPYVIREPGPTFNALGTEQTDQGEREVIEISGAPTYDTGSGQLRVMTVSIYGNPQSQPNWWQVMAAWFTPGDDVLPVEAYYPDGTSTQERDEQTAEMMTQAQDTAVAAALTKLGYKVPETMAVIEVTQGAAAEGKLEVGDQIVTIDGQPVANLDELNALKLREEPTPVMVIRNGAEHTETVTPTPDANGTPRLGIQLQSAYDFPISVQIDLGDVGGPSAGLMFALAIYDKLTEGDLTGGEVVSGTGTISADGKVGPIGGIRQKLYAAAKLGANYFLAPESNCAEALNGGIPGGMTVFAVADLDEALRVVTTNAEHEPTNTLRSCQDALAAKVPQD